jgi:CBS domain containing-hemolysin-like protein
MPDYLAIVASILLAGFHSGSEMGFYCANRLRLRLRADRAFPGARRLQRLVSNPALAITTMLVGTNLGLYLATVAVTGRLGQTRWAAQADLLSSLIMPPVLVVFAEMIPKSLFQHHADTLMYHAVWPLRVSEIVFYPFSRLLRWVSALPKALLARRVSPQRPVVTPDTFHFYLSESASQGLLSPFQQKLAVNIMRLKSVQVDRVMTPLERVVMVAEDAPVGELLDALQQHDYARIPVWRGSRDKIVGVISALDVAIAGSAASVSQLARGVLSVKAGSLVADALWGLRQARQHLAAVVADDGRCVGIVTVKDLVEEIVGELRAW